MLGTRPDVNLSVARALIYGGYSYVLLGEGFCEAPVNLSAALPSTELLTRAIAHFDEGIAAATAATTPANAVAAQDLISLARVGQEGRPGEGPHVRPGGAGRLRAVGLLLRELRP